MINKWIFLFVLGLYLLITPTFAWLYDWDCRQPINISNMAGDLTNYQVRIDLNSTNVGSNFNWSNNGSDIRFTNSTDNLLNFWIEDWNSTGQEAVIWVNVTSLLNNTNTTIYMYYGNLEASSTSDAEAVFDFFDDFEDGILDGWSFEGENNWDISENHYEGSWGAENGDLGDIGMHACMYRNIILSMQGNITFWWSATCFGSEYLQFYIDGSKKAEVSESTAWEKRTYNLSNGTHSIKWCFEQWSEEEFAKGYVDYIIVRKQADPELSISGYGDEEKFSIILNSPSNQTMMSNSTPDFNFTVSGTETSYSCELFINDTGYGTATANNNSATIITANQSLSDGTYNWYIYCSSFTHSEIREITIDTLIPSIFDQQISTTYYNGTVNLSDTNFVTDKEQIKVNVSASDIHLDSVWVRIYNSITDYLMSLVSGTLYEVNISLSKGDYNLSSFANDTAGNQNNTANQSITVSDFNLSFYIAVSDKWDTYKNIIANSTINKVKWINDTGSSLPYKLNILGYYVNGDSCKVNDVSYSVSGGICDYTHTINKGSVYPDLEFYDSDYGNGTPVTQTLGDEQTPTGKWYRNVTLTYYLPNGSTAPQGTFTNATTLTLCLNSIITSGEYIKYFNGTDFVDITPSVYGSWEKKTVNSNVFYVLEDDLCNGDGIKDFKVKVESNMHSQYIFEFGGTVNTNPSINAVTLNISNLGSDNEVVLQVGVTDGDGLSDRDCVWIGTYFNCSFGELNPVVVDITNNLNYFGTIYANDSLNNIDSYDINYTFTNNSYFHNSSAVTNLSYQRIYKQDTLKNDENESLKYSVNHFNKYSGTLLIGGTFSGELSNNSNTTLYSEWSGDWLNESYSLPVLATDSVVKVNTYQIYNFTLNISKTADVNFTNASVDFSNYYDSSIYSNLTSNTLTKNFTSTETNLLLQLNASTITQKTTADTNCPVGYTKGEYSGYGYCKKTTGTEDTREVSYIVWINVKDNSSRNYEINFSMPFISEDLSDLTSLNYTVNDSDTDLSFSTSSKILTIGKNHSTSSLSEGEYQVEVDFSYPYTGGTTGGGGGVSAVCGNGICEIGETPENCPLDCENATFELNLDHLVLIGYPGSKIRCWGIEKGCALKISNPSEKKVHIRVEIESNDESKDWISLSLDEENWAQILDFDLVGNSERWIYFDIRVPKDAEIGRDYQSNLKFVSSNYALSFPIVMRIEKSKILSIERILLLLSSNVIEFPKSGIELKLWHILFALLLLIVFAYPVLKNKGLRGRKYE